MQRVIEIHLSPQGDVRLQTKGFTGNDCFQASQFLEKALGSPTHVQKTSEFFQTEANEQTIQQ